jgi:hypothetical protein
LVSHSRLQPSPPHAAQSPPEDRRRDVALSALEKWAESSSVELKARGPESFRAEEDFREQLFSPAAR